MFNNEPSYRKTAKLKKPRSARRTELHCSTNSGITILVPCKDRKTKLKVPNFEQF